MRRFTRLTNAFSKKVENHAYSVSLHFMYYNFCRQHKSLKGITPAMAAGVTKRLRAASAWWSPARRIRLPGGSGARIKARRSRASFILVFPRLWLAQWAMHSGFFVGHDFRVVKRSRLA